VVESGALVFKGKVHLADVTPKAILHINIALGEHVEAVIKPAHFPVSLLVGFFAGIAPLVVF